MYIVTEQNIKHHPLKFKSLDPWNSLDNVYTFYPTQYSYT